MHEYTIESGDNPITVVSLSDIHKVLHDKYGTMSFNVQPDYKSFGYHPLSIVNNLPHYNDFIQITFYGNGTCLVGKNINGSTVWIREINVAIEESKKLGARLSPEMLNCIKELAPTIYDIF